MEDCSLNVICVEAFGLWIFRSMQFLDGLFPPCVNRNFYDVFVAIILEFDYTMPSFKGHT